MTYAEEIALERRSDSAAKRALKDAQREKVLASVRRFNDGERTLKEVANMAGISYSSAKSIVARYGLPRPKNSRQA